MQIDFTVKSPEGIPYTVKAPLGTSNAEIVNRVKQFHDRIKQKDVGWDTIQQIESQGNPNAISKKGAKGDMQTMPKTLTDPGFGVKPAKDNSPEELHRVGVDYWKAMKEKFGHPLVAAMGYNWGPTNVENWQKSGHDWSKVPQETKDYVSKIIAKFSGKK